LSDFTNATHTHLTNATGGLGAIAHIKTGTYTGDDTASQGITGIGFTPKVVRVWLRRTGANSLLEWWTTTEKVDNNVAGLAAFLDGDTPDLFTVLNAIISLDADGFTVDDGGANAHPNASGNTYEYWAIG